MLINYDPTEPLYILGTGVPAQSMKFMLENENIQHIGLVSHDEFSNIPHQAQCLLGFLNCQYRKNFLENFDIKRYRWPSYVHNSAVMSADVTLEPGIFVGPLCQVSYMSKMGAFSHLATQNLLGHDSWIGENTVLTPGVTIAGGNRIGSNVWFGARCVVRDQIVIVSDCEFAINTVVRKSVLQPGKYHNRNNALVRH